MAEVATGSIAAGANAAVGHFVEGYIAAAAGVVMSWLVESTTDIAGKTGEGLHKWIFPQQHRILDFEHSVKSLREET